MHIGLIGGIGPAATVFYYEQLVRAFDAAGQPLHLTIGHTSARTLSENVSAGRADDQAREYLRVTNQLAAAGAETIVITSMGGHFCAKEFTALSPLPIINGPMAVAEKLKADGIDHIGILGTRVVMQTALYGALADLNPIAPTGDLLEQVNADYMAMAIAGAATDDQRTRLLDAGRQLVQQHGAKAILLGGTDLNLVYTPDLDLGFPVIDSAAVHADAIVARALSKS